MSKQFWAIIAVIVVAFVGILWFNGHKKNTNNTNTSAKTSNHVEGNTSSKVTLVEYGDYECPVCGSYYPVVKQVAAKYNTQIAFQFRNLPLSQVHQFAFASARAAEAASLQGKFWEMHDALYEGQTTWAQSQNPNTYFTQYAQQLGLDMTKYQQDFASSAVNDTINADISAFKATGNQEATPTFFLNGKKLEPTQLTDSNHLPQLDKFSALIDAALKDAK